MTRHSSCVIRHCHGTGGRRVAASPRRRVTAFTLLELLLALSITVIIGAILSSSLYTAFRSRDAIERAVDSAQNTSVAADIIAQELPLALPPTPPPADANNLASFFPGLGATGQSLIGTFYGTLDTLEYFISGPEPKSDLQADTRQVTYLLVDDNAAKTGNTTKNLVRRVRTNILDVNTIDPPDEILARNVVKLAFKYYDGETWPEIWDSTQQSNHLPVAVQFTLELAPLHSGESSRIDTRTISLPCGIPAPVDTGMGGLLP